MLASEDWQGLGMLVKEFALVELQDFVNIRIESNLHRQNYQNQFKPN
jgi:hypothetical protein